MALVKFGAGVAGMTGSIGGTTFARNKYGSYARNRTKPINRKTPAQIKIRNAVSAASQRWFTTVTAAQRAAWDTYAANVVMKNRLGEATYLSGFNHYVRSNSIRILAYRSPVDAGPVIYELPEKDGTLAITASEATQLINVAFDNTADWALEPNGYLIVFQSRPQNITKVFFAGPWRIAGSLPGSTPVPPASPFAVGTIFAFAEDHVLFLYARISRADGRLSEPFQVQCTAGA